MFGLLVSAPVAAQLRDASFIACAGLSGSAPNGDCQPGWPGTPIAG
jgi:hypothetical protein